jgi:hypothetical protein
MDLDLPHFPWPHAGMINARALTHVTMTIRPAGRVAGLAR